MMTRKMTPISGRAAIVAMLAFAMFAISGCGGSTKVTLGPNTPAATPTQIAKLCTAIFGSDQAVSSQFKPGIAEPLSLDPGSRHTGYNYFPSSHLPYLKCDYVTPDGSSFGLLLEIGGASGTRAGDAGGGAFYGHRAGSLRASALNSFDGYALPQRAEAFLTNAAKRVEVGS